VIEPTDDMIEAVEQVDGLAYVHPDLARRIAAAVLAIVERDYVVLCGAVRPPDDSGLGALTCNGRLGHDPDHRHLDGDWLVIWP